MLLEWFCSEGEEDDDSEEDRGAEIGEIDAFKEISENKIEFIIMIFLLFFGLFMDKSFKESCLQGFCYDSVETSHCF